MRPPARRRIVPGAGPEQGARPTLCAVDRLDRPDRTVITGAAGWLGRALLHAHRRDADHGSRTPAVTAVVAGPDQFDAARAVHPDADVVIADVRDAERVHDVLRAATRNGGVVDLVHTAGVIHPRRTSEFDAVNARGTANVADAALAAGIRRMVHVSSNSPFGVNPTTRDTFGTHEPYHPYLGYGRSKMHAELAVLDAVERGLDAVVVRPPWFYGPWQPERQTTFFTMVRRGRFPVLGHGDQRRSMVYVDNLVDGVAAAQLTAGVTGRGYWIADARPYTIHEIVGAVRDALIAAGLPCAERSLQLPLAVGRIAERIDRALQGVGRYQQQLHVLGELSHTIAVDITAATEELGYRPQVALPDGMRASVAWCLEQGIEL